MPIDYREYHPKWKLIVRLIRKREGDCCKFCRVANYMVTRINNVTKDFEIHHYNWAQDQFDNQKEAKETADHLNTACADGEGKWIVIVLTIAHLDGNKENNRFTNLAALCQRCHLKHDLGHHIMNRKYGRHHDRKHQLKLFI